MLTVGFSLFMVGSASAEHDNPVDQERLQFAHRPLHPGAELPGLYVNELFGQDEALLNVYGTPGLEPDATYDDNATEAPFDPDVIPSDSVTFNPAIIRSDRDEWISQGNPDIDGCFGGNMNLKKHLRLYYTPAHDYEGPRTDAGLYDPATQADTVNLESTYILTDGDSNEPQPMCNDSTIPFPTVGNDVFIEDDDPADDCNCAFGLNGSQPGVDNMTIVDVKNVEAAGFDGGTWESGQFQIEQQVSLAKGQAVQFLDRVYQYRGLGESGSGDGSTVAFFKTWYAGNTFLDAPQEHAIERSDRILTPHGETVNQPDDIVTILCRGGDPEEALAAFLDEGPRPNP